MSATELVREFSATTCVELQTACCREDIRNESNSKRVYFCELACAYAHKWSPVRESCAAKLAALRTRFLSSKFEGAEQTNERQQQQLTPLWNENDD